MTKFFTDIVNAARLNDGLRGIFSIILVATILTMFELGMFYKLITHEVKTQVDNGIESIGAALKSVVRTSVANMEKVLDARSKEVESKVQQMTGQKVNLGVKDIILTSTKDALQSSLGNILDTFSERETILTNKINTYTKASAALLLLVLVLLMVIIKVIIKSRGDILGWCTWLISFITVGMILAFQYAFFLFGKQYKYIGSKGKEELLVYLMEKIVHT